MRHGSDGHFILPLSSALPPASVGLRDLLLDIPQRANPRCNHRTAMQFCDDCGSAMVKVDDVWTCRECDPESVAEATDRSPGETPAPRRAKLNELPTTDSGSVKKSDAMRWLNSLDRPSDAELKRALVPKPSGFTGSSYPTSISNIRVTGDPAFIETIAGLLKPITELEQGRTRVELNLQQTEDRESGELNGNYALYLSIAERG